MSSITRFSPLREAFEGAQGLANTSPTLTPVPDGWEEIARRRKRSPQVRVTLRVDEDVAAFFRGLGPGHQSRMNDVLRSFMLAYEGGWLPVAGVRWVGSSKALCGVTLTRTSQPRHQAIFDLEPLSHTHYIESTTSGTPCQTLPV